MLELMNIDQVASVDHGCYWAVNCLVIMETQRCATFTIIILLSKITLVVLVTVHAEDNKVSFLLVAGTEKMKIENCLLVRIDWK
jgi:hypothetical protein